MKCPNCGMNIDDGARFCGECGKPVPPPQAASGISMGDKNVVAGDVIGKKEDYIVAGNMINRVSLNETDKVLTCHVCGKHITNVDGYSCPSCGNFVCKEHFDKDRKLCTSCIDARKQASIERYKEILAEVVVDGKIDAEGNRRLYEANMFECHLSPKLTAELRDAYINEIRGPSELEKLDIEKFDEEFNSNRCMEAYKRIQPIYQRHPTDEGILIRYIRSIKKADPAAATEFIQKLKVDLKEAYLASADIYLQHNQLGECEKTLNNASTKWKNDVLVNSAMARYFAVCAKRYNNNDILTEAETLLNSCEAPRDEYEQESLNCAKAMVAFVKSGTKELFSGLNAYWASFSALMTNKITVAQDGSADYTTISAAINACDNGAEISVMPGKYVEILDISKSVSIEGVEKAGLKPVILREGDAKEALLKISGSNVKVSNIDFVGGFVPSGDYFGSPLKEEQVADAAQLIYVSGANVELNNVNVYKCFGIGMVLQDAQNIQVVNSNFFHNQKSGVCALGNCSGTFKDCFLAENGDFGFERFSEQQITFDNSHELNNRFGFFIDKRDGESYRTVKIGKQTWMCENLRYDCGEGCSFAGSDDESKSIGAFYTWNAMTNCADKLTVEQSLSNYEFLTVSKGKANAALKSYWQDMAKLLGKVKIHGIAPEGWRIPSCADYVELIGYCQKNLPANEKVISHGLISVDDTNDAKSTDYFGFGGLISGSQKFADGVMEDLGKKGKFWTLNLNAADTAAKKADAFVLTERNAEVNDSINRTASALNLRCILDEDSEVNIVDGDRQFNDKIDYLLEMYAAGAERNRGLEDVNKYYEKYGDNMTPEQSKEYEDISNLAIARDELFLEKYGF